MHVGMSVFPQALGAGGDDRAVYESELAMAEQAEPAGFDSVWTAEHHFSGYTMTPNPAQFLSWVAGRTSEVRLGSMVTVLPWHDPVRVAEQWILLDHLSRGRAVLGLGRGLGPTEFDGFRVEMGESRRRFVEYAEAITTALETGVMEYDGELYQQPRVELRPAPYGSFAGRTYASAVSPESARIMAELGMGIMIIAQKPWETTLKEMEQYRALFLEVNGVPAPRPLLVSFTCVHADAAAAADMHERYQVAYSQSAADHYQFTNPRLERIPGYEYYGRLRATIEKHGIERFVRFLADLQLSGTPDDVAAQTVERVRLLDAAGVINVFSFGGMARDVAQANLDAYVEHVLPLLKATDAFRDLGSRSRASRGSRGAPGPARPRA
jgi:alkanesulfonate monooxygenase SsuD/methylene tetrahydromethanopterin reductase-like flavin-dependent oxidoreductase (luciferase family)